MTKAFTLFRPAKTRMKDVCSRVQCLKSRASSQNKRGKQHKKSRIGGLDDKAGRKDALSSAKDQQNKTDFRNAQAWHSAVTRNQPLPPRERTQYLSHHLDRDARPSLDRPNAAQCMPNNPQGLITTHGHQVRESQYHRSPYLERSNVHHDGY